MTVFESIVHIPQSVNDVYRFLSDLNNHQQLMPLQVQDWHSTTDEAAFTIQNMASLRLVIREKIENSSIIIDAADEPPFNITFTWLLAQETGYTSVKYTIVAQLNMMMKMLASGPLQKLADHETQALTEILK